MPRFLSAVWTSPHSSCLVHTSTFVHQTPNSNTAEPTRPAPAWPSSTSGKWCHRTPYCLDQNFGVALGSSYFLLCTPPHRSSQLFFQTPQTATPHFRHNHSALSRHRLPTGNSINLLAGLLPLPFPVQPSHTPAARATCLKTEVGYATPLLSG